MKNRVGEKWLNREGYEAIIIEYNGALDCTIQFNDANKTIIKKQRL